MEIKEKIINLKENIDSLSFKQVNYAINILLFGFVLNIIFVYWFLKFKVISHAITVVLILIMAFALFIRKMKGGKMEETEEKETKEEPESNESMTGIDLGLPSADEFNKRLEKAIGI